MLDFVKNSIQKSAGFLGYKVIKLLPPPPIEFSQEDIKLVEYVLAKQLSMVSPFGLYSTLSACKYIVENNLPGDFVECGVWRGGNALIAADVFKRHRVKKKIYLFDTFEGMTEPSEEDVSLQGRVPALTQYLESRRESHNEWCFAPVEEVAKNFDAKGLLSEDLIFVKGPVEDTLRVEQNLPKEICFLRLDTDWYESTRVELEVLYPRLVKGGVLAIDDYGFWSGSKKATDEFFSAPEKRPFFHAIDEERRVAIKLT